MGFKLFKDTVELPCKLSGQTLYVGCPEYYKTYQLSWLRFPGLEFDWQQNSIQDNNDYLRGKLYNNIFEMLIDGEMEITLIHRKSNLIIANFKPNKFLYEFIGSYDDTDDFVDKRVGSYEMRLDFSETVVNEQIILESKSNCFSNMLKTCKKGITNLGEDTDFSFLFVPSGLSRVRSCLIVEKSIADNMYELACRLSPKEHILPIYKMYKEGKQGYYLQYEESNYSVKLLEYITVDYGRKVFDR